MSDEINSTSTDQDTEVSRLVDLLQSGQVEGFILHIGAIFALDMDSNQGLITEVAGALYPLLDVGVFGKLPYDSKLCLVDSVGRLGNLNGSSDVISNLARIATKYGDKTKDSVYTGMYESLGGYAVSSLGNMGYDALNPLFELITRSKCDKSTIRDAIKELIIDFDDTQLTDYIGLLESNIYNSRFTEMVGGEVYMLTLLSDLESSQTAPLLWRVFQQYETVGGYMFKETRLRVLDLIYKHGSVHDEDLLIQAFNEARDADIKYSIISALSKHGQLSAIRLLIGLAGGNILYDYAAIEALKNLNVSTENIMEMTRLFLLERPTNPNLKYAIADFLKIKGNTQVVETLENRNARFRQSERALAKEIIHSIKNRESVSPFAPSLSTSNLKKED